MLLAVAYGLARAGTPADEQFAERVAGTATRDEEALFPTGAPL